MIKKAARTTALIMIPWTCFIIERSRKEASSKNPPKVLDACKYREKDWLRCDNCRFYLTRNLLKSDRLKSVIQSGLSNDAE